MTPNVAHHYDSIAARSRDAADSLTALVTTANYEYGDYDLFDIGLVMRLSELRAASD